MFNPIRIAVNKQMIPINKSRDFDLTVVVLFSKYACSNEKPVWKNKIAIRNSIASNALKENPGGLSQNGSVVPTRAGSKDAVQ